MKRERDNISSLCNGKSTRNALDGDESMGDLRNLLEADPAGHGRASLVDKQRDLVEYHWGGSSLVQWLHVVTAGSLIGLSGYEV